MRLVVVNGLLLALAGIAILGVIAFDRSDASAEGVVRRYALAVSNNDLDGALDEIARSARCVSRVAPTQVGNIYEVRGIAVRSPSVFEQVVQGEGPSEVMVVLDVNRGYAVSSISRRRMCRPSRWMGGGISNSRYWRTASRGRGTQPIGVPWNSNLRAGRCPGSARTRSAPGADR
jgi:hypothetical protein